MGEASINRRDLLKGSVLLLTAPFARSIAFAESPSSALLPGRPSAPASIYDWPVHKLLKADTQHALFVRNLSKPIRKSLLIDDMETDRGWESSPAVQLSYTKERAKAGIRSLRFTTDQRSEEYIRSSRSANGSFSGNGPTFTFAQGAAWARLKLAQPQDWSEYNRISVWCYLHPTGNPISSICLQFLCDGAPSGPSDPVALNYIGDLKEGEWNLLAWEISEYQRDRISEFLIFQPLSGVPFHNLESRLTYDFDQLQVERIDVEQVSGWQVAPSKISYSHVGYPAFGQKQAISSDLPATTFELVDSSTGAVAATFPATKVETLRGQYSILDFSAFNKPGTYRIRVGAVNSEQFSVSNDPWRPLVESTLNAFYGLRCGFAVPGMHEACHCDVIAQYKGEKRSVGGGWHDAANMSQDTENTNSSVIALIDMAEALAPYDKELAARALEEARWGLEWIMRMRFEPGIRLLAGNYSFYTDGIVGDSDDVVIENPDELPKRSAPSTINDQGGFGMMMRPVIASDTFLNLGGALAEVRGARALKSSDPKLSAELLKAAEEDFATVLRDRPEPPAEKGAPNWHVQCWQNEAGFMALTAVELFRETGKSSYAESAVKLARWVLDVQEFRFIGGSPVTGYFYEDAARTRILREQQRSSGAMNSFEEGACLAYQALCETFPNHPDWIRWYEGIVTYSEFFCRKGAEASAPFQMIPAAVWRESDLDAPVSQDMLASRGTTHPDALFSSPVTPELVAHQLRELYEAGTYLSPEQRLRVLPLPMDHIRHGGTTVHLTKTVGLAAAAQLRRDSGLAQLAANQVQWVAGANPFSRSLIYGVGYDWWQNFTVALPNIYGGMAVGMNTYRHDAPAWGNNALFPYKEIWVETSARFAAVLARLPGNVRVAGNAPQGATFKATATGQLTKAAPGSFSLNLAPGSYTVSYGGFAKRLDLVPGGAYDLKLDAARAFDLKFEKKDDSDGASLLQLQIRGSGMHEVELRAINAELSSRNLSVDLGNSGTRIIAISLRATERDRAWIVVAVPDGRVSEAVELFGAPAGLAELGGAK